MYQEHKCFDLSCSLDSKVWRYMDFTKYVSMLEEGALWFSRADCLTDPFDSEVPNSAIVSVKQKWEKTIKEVKSSELSDEIKTALIQQIRSGQDYRKTTRSQYAVNCWHQNEHESAAMWKLYLKSDEGIAVVSTPRKLIESVRDSSSLMFVGSIEYVDFDTYPPVTNAFQPVMRKRKSFEHERELRIVAVRTKDGNWSGEAFEEAGIAVRVDVSLLIDAVCVSPTAPEWFARLVAQVSRRFGLECEVLPSTLAQRPLW